MLDRRSAVYGWTLVVAACLATIALAQEKGADARPLKVGVVDMGVAFKRYARRDELEKEIDTCRARCQQDLKALEAPLNELRMQMHGMTPDMPSYRDKRVELTSLVEKYELSRQTGEQEVQIRIEGATLKLLDEIDDVVGQYGAANGYDLVLRIDAGHMSNSISSDPKGLSDGEFSRRVLESNLRDVLYRDARLDVTEAVVKALNTEENLKKRRAQ